jgi:methylated-DNA-[protein]-cysteine S-methyltransferase
MELYYSKMESPIGVLTLVGNNEGLHQILFQNEIKKVHNWKKKDSFFESIKQQLYQYFTGKVKKLEIELSLQGTEFQQKVWAALLEIPYGETRTYSEIAQFIGSPKGQRAVGLANNRNPIPIIIPCHRVIGKNGSLTGYAGGLNVKEWLLRLETSLSP